MKTIIKNIASWFLGVVIFTMVCFGLQFLVLLSINFIGQTSWAFVYALFFRISIVFGLVLGTLSYADNYPTLLIDEIGLL